MRSPITTLAITAFGQANPNFIIRRAIAQVGNAIVITGIPKQITPSGLKKQLIY